MCGIVGLVNLAPHFGYGYGGKTDQALTKWIGQALFVDQLRGSDSTGLCLVDTKGTQEVFKKALPACDFLDLRKTYNLLLDVPYSSVVIGHNRAKTYGAASAENAHPFEHGHITLVHNGTLRTFTNLEGNFTVDSEAIAYTMSKLGEKATLEKLNGAFTLVWYNSKDNTVNFARNEERPLSAGLTKDGTALLFASEEWMLWGVATRRGVGIELDEVFEIPTHTHIKIDINALDFKKVKKTKFTGYVAPVIKQAVYDPETRYRDGQKFLADLSLDRGDFVTFVPKVFKRYSTNSGYSTGKLDGEVKMLDASKKEKTILVRLHNIVDERALTLLKFAHCGSNITHTTSEDDKTYLALDAKTVRKVSDAELAEIEEARKSFNEGLILNAEEEDDSKDNVLLCGPYNKLISLEKFDELTKYGCSGCSDNLSASDNFSMEWTSQGEPVCKQCGITYGIGMYADADKSKKTA